MNMILHKRQPSNTVNCLYLNVSWDHLGPKYHLLIAGVNIIDVS